MHPCFGAGAYLELKNVIIKGGELLHSSVADLCPPVGICWAP